MYLHSILPSFSQLIFIPISIHELITLIYKTRKQQDGGVTARYRWVLKCILKFVLSHLIKLAEINFYFNLWA